MKDSAFILEGVYVAAVTPFDADGRVDYDRLGQVVEHCIDGGVAGLVIAGTTGEYYAMREQERLELFRSRSRLHRRTDFNYRRM